MENLDVLYEILLLICQWWNIEHPGLFLMKIHPVERKLYQIINGGTTALVYDESYLTLRGMHSWLNPLCKYSLSAINRLIACLHFRVQRDYKMPRNLGVMGIDRGLHASFASQPAIILPMPLRCCKTLISILSHPKSALDIHTHSNDNLMIGYSEAPPRVSQLVGRVNAK